MMGDYRRNYKFKAKFGMLGPVASGKSTIAAGIVYTCETLSALIPNFYARVLPTSSHILQDANNLRQGKFPKKTNPLHPRAPEAGLLISERGMLKNTGVHVPICDVAGEVTDYIYKKCDLSPREQIDARLGSINRTVVDTIRDCEGFIIALDANDSIIFCKAEENDNDVYVHSVLTNILEWRRTHRKKDPHIIVVITKWDEVISKAKDVGMDVYDESQYGLARFIDNGFPATSMLLKPLRDKGMVKYFRSWFTLATDNEQKTLYWDTEKLKPKIKIIEDANEYIRFRPDFSLPDYIALVNYIGSFG